MVSSACRGPSCWIGKIIILAQLNRRTRDVQTRVAESPILKSVLGSLGLLYWHTPFAQGRCNEFTVELN
jgi:hypothetical protein